MVMAAQTNISSKRIIIDVPKDLLYRMVREHNNPFDMESVLKTSAKFTEFVVWSDGTKSSATLSSLTTIPPSQEHHYAAMLRFKSLASRSCPPKMRQNIAMSYHWLWFHGVTSGGWITSPLAYDTGVGFLYASVFPFMQDYIFKATHLNAEGLRYTRRHRAGPMHRCADVERFHARLAGRTTWKRHSLRFRFTVICTKRSETYV